MAMEPYVAAPLFRWNLLGVPELCGRLKQCGAGKKKGGGVKVLIIFSNQINREMEVVQSLNDNESLLDEIVRKQTAFENTNSKAL